MGDSPRSFDDETKRIRYGVPPCLDDVRARRQTEIDWITGAIVREAHKLGVPVPIHETLYRLVKGVEASWALSRPQEQERRSA